MQLSEQSSSDASSISLGDYPLILEHRNSFNIECVSDTLNKENHIAVLFESWQENFNNLNLVKRLSCPNFLKDSKRNSLIGNVQVLKLEALKRNSGKETEMEIERPQNGETDYITPKTSSINHILGQIRTNQFEGKEAPKLNSKTQRRIDQLQNAPCRPSNKDDQLEF